MPISDFHWSQSLTYCASSQPFNSAQSSGKYGIIRMFQTSHSIQVIFHRFCISMQLYAADNTGIAQISLACSGLLMAHRMQNAELWWTYDLDLRKWHQAELTHQISRSKNIPFKSSCPDTQAAIWHTHRTKCCTVLGPLWSITVPIQYIKSENSQALDWNHAII